MNFSRFLLTASFGSLLIDTQESAMNSSPSTSTKALKGVWPGLAVLVLTLSALPVFGSTITVTNTNDSGPGSLRAAIQNAAAGDTINFSLTYPATITLSTPLELGNNLTISGPDASLLSISGGNSVVVFVTSANFSGFFPRGPTISGVTIEHGSSNYGGGIRNDYGFLTLINSTVSGNSTSFDGGGIFNYCCSVTLINSTVSGNSALQGGGIFNNGTPFPTFSGAVGYSTVYLTNSTVSGNSAGTAGGGGIYNGEFLDELLGEFFGVVILNNSTVWGNTSQGPEGSAGGIFNAGALYVKNSILANNTESNCGTTETALAISYGHNLSDEATCVGFFTGPGDLNSTPAGLDPGGLKNNGGPTQTIALLSTSVAVNAIPLSPTNYCTDAFGDPITTDQRGVPRPQGPACDMGAYEFFPSLFTVATADVFFVINSVQSLSLRPGTQTSLIAPLQAALLFLNRGDVTTARTQLGAFIHQVNALVLSGALTPPQASALAAPVQEFIGLPCFPWDPVCGIRP